MDKELIKGLIAEYQQFVKSVSFVKRAVTLSDNFNYVFVGLRRVGKSYLMYQQIHHLIETGISPEEILFFNFEDERIAGMDTEHLDMIKRCYEEMYSHDRYTGHHCGGLRSVKFVFLSVRKLVPVCDRDLCSSVDFFPAPVFFGEIKSLCEPFSGRSEHCHVFRHHCLAASGQRMVRAACRSHNRYYHSALPHLCFLPQVQAPLHIVPGCSGSGGDRGSDNLY